MAIIRLDEETSTPSTPSSGKGIYYFKNNKFPYALNSDGTEMILAPGADNGILNKLDATVAPTVNEDSGDGYSVGSQWVDVTADKTYFCQDSTVGAAVWQELVDGITTTSSDTLQNKTINADENTIKVYTEIITGSAGPTLTDTECYGGVYYVDTADTITLPAIADGMSITVLTVGAVAVVITANASDKIWLDGTAGADGGSITNTSTSGDVAVLTYYSADGWYASTNGWS